METRKLELTIISAEEVKQVKWTGKMSPYAVAWVYPTNKVITQVCQEGGKNPKWNEKFELQVEERLLQSPKATLTIEVYHDAPFGPKRLGVVNIPFTEVVKDCTEGSQEAKYMAYQIRRIKSGRTQGVLNVAIALGRKGEVINGAAISEAAYSEAAYSEASSEASSSETGAVESAMSRLTVNGESPPDQKVSAVEKAEMAASEQKAEMAAMPLYPVLEQVAAVETVVTDEKASSEQKAENPAMPAYPAPTGYTQGYPPAAYAYPPVPYQVYAPVGYAQAYPALPSPPGYPQGYAPPPPGYPQGYPQGYPPPAHSYPQGYPAQPYPVAYGVYPPPPPYYGAPGGQYAYPPQQQPPKRSGFGGGGAGLGLGLGAGLLGGVLLGEALDDDGGDC